MKKQWFYILIVFSFMCVMTTQAQETSVVAVDPVQLHAKVIYLSKNQLYINIGFELGIQTQDTVWISTQTQEQVPYKVVQSSSNSSLVQPLDKLLLVTIGNELIITFSPNQKEEKQIAETVNRESILGISEGRKTASREAVISGRYVFGLNTVASRTLWNEHIKEAFYRVSVEPQVGYSLRATNLAGGFDFNLNTRMDYRYYSKNTIELPLQLRVYDFSIQKKFKKLPVQIEAGRFSNDFNIFGGYWDGLLINIGNQHVGFGTAIGTEPDRSSEWLSVNYPKVSFYSYANQKWKSVSTSTELSYTNAQPVGGITHQYLGVNQRFRWADFRVNVSSQIDQDPVTNNWKASFLTVQARQKLFKNVDVYTQYTHRQLYRDWLAQPFGTVNEQVGGGITIRMKSWLVGQDVSINQLAGSQTSWSYSNWFSWNNLTRWNIDYQLSNQFWSGYRAFAISSQSQFSKYVRSQNWLSVGYQFNYSNYYDAISHTHGLFSQYQMRFNKQTHLSIRYSVDAGLLMIRTGLWVSFWRSF